MVLRCHGGAWVTDVRQPLHPEGPSKTNAGCCTIRNELETWRARFAEPGDAAVLAVNALCGPRRTTISLHHLLALLRTIRLDHIGPSGNRCTITARSASSTVLGSFRIEGTIDDPALVASPLWFGISSNGVFGSTTPTIWDSTNATDFDSFPPVIAVTTPLAAVRLNSTGLTAGSNTLTLSALQAGSY